MKLAKRIDITSSATVKMNELAIRKRKEGISLYNFSAGDPMISVHPIILEEMEKSLKENNGVISYAPSAGLIELRELASLWMNKKHGANFGVQETIVTNGGKFALFLLLQALVESNDEVLIPTPYWVSYPTIVEICGGLPILVETNKDWKVTPELLQKYISPKSKVLVLNSGCNPTGILYSKAELWALLNFAKENDLFVISDEVYSEIIYDNNRYVSCATFAEFHDHLAIVQSCSKNFCMTGWRVGLSFGPEWLMKELIKLLSHSTTGTSTLCQWAAMGAFRNAELITKQVCKEMCKRRDFFVSTFNRLFKTVLTPTSSAIYQWISMGKLNISERDSKVFCEVALENVSVAMVPGIAFGQDGYVRLAFSEKEEEIEGGLKALWKFCQEVNNG